MKCLSLASAKTKRNEESIIVNQSRTRAYYKWWFRYVLIKILLQLFLKPGIGFILDRKEEAKI